MRKIINRYSAVFMLTLTISNCLIPHTAAAAKESPPDPEITEEYGILAVECNDTHGIVTVSFADVTESFEYDYYEMMVPVEEIILVTISPDTCYAVTEVSLDKVPIEEVNGSYSAVITESFMTLNIIYEKTPDTDTDDGSDVVIENPIKTSPSETENSSSADSVGCISSEVTVIYLDKDETTETETVPPEEGNNSHQPVIETDPSTQDNSSAENVAVPKTETTLKREPEKKAVSAPKDSIDRPAEPTVPKAKSSDIENIHLDLLPASPDIDKGMKNGNTASINITHNIRSENDHPIYLLSGLGLYIVLLLFMTIIHIVRIFLKNVISGRR